MTSAGSLRPTLAYSFFFYSQSLNLRVLLHSSYIWFPHSLVRKKWTEELQIKFFCSSFLCIKRRCIRNIMSFLQVEIPGTGAAHRPEKSLKTITTKNKSKPLLYFDLFFCSLLWCRWCRSWEFCCVFLFGCQKWDFAIYKTAAGVWFTFTDRKSHSLYLKHGNISFYWF